MTALMQAPTRLPWAPLGWDLIMQDLTLWRRLSAILVWRGVGHWAKRTRKHRCTL
jgi:hypothetical protein